MDRLHVKKELLINPQVNLVFEKLVWKYYEYAQFKIRFSLSSHLEDLLIKKLVSIKCMEEFLNSLNSESNVLRFTKTKSNSIDLTLKPAFRHSKAYSNVSHGVSLN